jgi:Zn-dependent peptidase ImmA (M78 family)
MSGEDYIVPPLSWPAIDQMADNLRAQFGLGDTPKFPIVEFLEEVLDYRLGITRFLVGDRLEMGTAEGLTDPAGQFVMLREDVYSKGLSGQGRDRFTAAHELGHLAMHTNIALARALPGQEVKPYSRAEPQANQFASGLLMPRRFFAPADTPETVAGRHGVSQEAARLRLEYFRKKGLL